MAKVLAIGPTSTAATDVVVTGSGVKFSVDSRRVEEAPGKAVYTDITCPLDQPETVRFSQMVRPNIYAGTSVEAAAMLASRKGCDTVVELKQMWKETDDTDPSYERLIPVRMALTMNLPLSGVVTSERVTAMLERLISYIAVEDAATIDSGIENLLHGVFTK